MGIATRYALCMILVACTGVAALAALLWLDSLAFDWAGYSTGSNNKLFFAGFAGTSAFLAWRMLVDPGWLLWGLLVSAAAGAVLVGVASRLPLSESCIDADPRSILGPGELLLRLCKERTDLGIVSIWTIRVSALFTAALALTLPVIEVWDRAKLGRRTKTWA